jgi:hypothetical protein
MVRSTQTVHLSCVRFNTISKQTKQASTWALSLSSTIGCVQNDFCAYGTFSANRAHNLHLHCHSHQMDWNEIPHDQSHLGDPSGASKTIYEPIIRSAQTMHLPCVKVSTISKRPKRASTWASSPRSTIERVQNDFRVYGTFDANRASFLCQV